MVEVRIRFVASLCDRSLFCDVPVSATGNERTLGGRVPEFHFPRVCLVNCVLRRINRALVSGGLSSGRYEWVISRATSDIVPPALGGRGKRIIMTREAAEERPGTVVGGLQIHILFVSRYTMNGPEEFH
jgi:hypothetical protein